MAFCFRNWNEKGNFPDKFNKPFSRHHSIHRSFVKPNGSQQELKWSYRYRLAENVLVRLVSLMFCSMLMIISYTTKKNKTRASLINKTNTYSYSLKFWSRAVQLYPLLFTVWKLSWMWIFAYMNLRRMAGLYMNAVFLCKKGDLCTDKIIYSLELCSKNISNSLPENGGSTK